jgi:hypothetical protein
VCTLSGYFHFHFHFHFHFLNMRFLVAAIASLSLVAADATEYDSLPSGSSSSINDIAAMNTNVHELPMGIEKAHIINSLSQFNPATLKLDRVVNYEVNPEFKFDSARSLDLKMRPILNIHKFKKSPSFYDYAPSNSHIRRQQLLKQLLDLGIEPATIKKFVFLKKQGLVDERLDAVGTMLKMQEIAANTNLNFENVNAAQPLTTNVNDFQVPFTTTAQPLEYEYETPFSTSADSDMNAYGYINEQPSLETEPLTSYAAYTAQPYTVTTAARPYSTAWTSTHPYTAWTSSFIQPTMMTSPILSTEFTQPLSSTSFNVGARELNDLSSRFGVGFGADSDSVYPNILGGSESIIPMTNVVHDMSDVYVDALHEGQWMKQKPATYQLPVKSKKIKIQKIIY